MAITLLKLDNGQVQMSGGTQETKTISNVNAVQHTDRIYLVSVFDGRIVHSIQAVNDDATNGVQTITDENGVDTTITDLASLWAAVRSFFSVGGGNGSGVAFIVPDSASIPFADNAARDTWAAANLSDLIKNQTVVSVTGAPNNTWYLWRGDSNPGSYVNTNWIDATPLVRGEKGDKGDTGAAGATGATGATGPAGESGVFSDETITASLTLDVANLGTYNRKNIIYTGSALAPVVSLTSIATFLAGSETFIIYRIINETDIPLTIRPFLSESIGQTTGDVQLQNGQSITVKLPGSGTRWDVIANSTGTSGGTAPIGPPGPTPSDVNKPVVLRDGSNNELTWDAGSGSFPTGTIEEGYLYKITGPGTLDGETFGVQDLLLAITDNPSSSVFANNWHRIDGDEYVHSWGGLIGVIDDNAITRVLSRLGYETVEPSAHNFSIDIPSRVDIDTDLNVSHTVTYDITNRTNIQSVELVVTTGDNKSLTLPTRDGTQTEAVVLSGITTSLATTVQFLIRVTDKASGTHDSNTITITVQNPPNHEQTHFGHILSTEDQTNIVFANDDIEARDDKAGSWTVSGIPASGLHRIYWAVPTADGSITRVAQGGFTLYESGLSSGNQFTNFTNITIGGQTYNILLMNVGSAVNDNYNGTTLTTT